MRKNPFSGQLILLVTALIWGSSFFVMKDAVSQMPVFALLAIRFTIGAALLCLVGWRRLRTASRSSWAHGVFCGVLQYCAYVAQTFGLAETTPGKNAFLTAVYCVLVPFVCWLRWRERTSVWNLLAAVLCVTGIGLVSLTGDLTIGRGDALTLLGGVLYALQVAYLGHFGQQGDDPVTLTVAEFLTAAALGWVCTLLWNRGYVIIPREAIGQLLYLGVVVTGLAMLLQAIGQSITPAPQAAILMSLESVFGVLFSVLCYGETIDLRMGIGFAVIFFSVLISEVPSALRPSAPPPADRG